MNRKTELSSETAKNASILTKDSADIKTKSSSSKEKVHNEVRYLEVTDFNPDGTIKSISKEWRGIDQQEKESSHQESSDNSVKETKVDSTSVTKAKKKEEVKKKNTDDSRPIQGSEWIYFVIGIVVIFIISKVAGSMRKKG